MMISNSIKNAEISPNEWKMLLVMSNFSFSNSVFIRLTADMLKTLVSARIKGTRNLRKQLCIGKSEGDQQSKWETLFYHWFAIQH